MPHSDSFPGFLCLLLQAYFLDKFYVVVSSSGMILQIVLGKTNIFTMMNFPMSGQDMFGESAFR